MKPVPLAALTIGLDVVSGESSLPKGAVRRARNVVIQNNGNWASRAGFATHIALEDTHSFWKSPAQTRVLAASGDTLYTVDLAAAAKAATFVGLPFEQPVEYCDVGPDIYFTSGNLLRKILADGRVRVPGIVNLLGNEPTLAATVGSLAPGRYGVAYSLVNDLGEESGISSIAWYTLAATGGLLVSALPTSVPNVASVVIYVTAPDAGELHAYATHPATAATSITDRTLGRLASRQFKQPMPGGDIVRLFRGRLYVARGRWIYVSDPLDYGVNDIRSGWMTFNRSITMMEPVENGIFVGLRERTILLRGNGPGDFAQVPASDLGAFAHTSQGVAGDYFNPDVAPSHEAPHAAWCTPRGLAVGRPDGSIAYPQAGRLLLDAGAGRPCFMQHDGIKQAVFCLDSLTIGVGGAVDTTI